MLAQLLLGTLLFWSAAALIGGNLAKNDSTTYDASFLIMPPECTQDSDCGGCAITWSDSEGNSGDDLPLPAGRLYNIGTDLKIQFSKFGAGAWSHGTCKCTDQTCGTNADCHGKAWMRAYTESNGVNIPTAGYCMKGSNSTSTSFAAGDYDLNGTMVDVEVTKCDDTPVTITLKRYDSSNCAAATDPPAFTFTVTLKCPKCKPNDPPPE